MALDPDFIAGLGTETQDKWPSITQTEARLPAIDRLRPNSLLHQKTLDYLLERIQMSERQMQQFYDRWRVQEKKYQAFIDLQKWDRVLKEMNDHGKSPKVVNIIVPYSFATINTIVTYLIHTFCGRKPMFQVNSYKAEGVQAAANMEQVLQYNCDHTRMVRNLFQYFTDGEQYGVAVMRTAWKTEKKLRTVWKSRPRMAFGVIPLGMERYKAREVRLVFEGNDVANIDPFMFFPDPRVPMAEVNKKGEFVFWRSYLGKHILKISEANGEVKWVDSAGDMPTTTVYNSEQGDSARSLMSRGNALPGYNNDPYTLRRNYFQVDQGSVEIIPAELGLGDGRLPEKWMFTILNKRQIVQAQPLNCDHDMHPVAVAEPYTMGYGFGNCGIADYLGPLQDTLSWYINSHMENVRTALNNMFIVDPSMVEMQDLKAPGPGKLIRLKRAAYGQDVRQAIQQLNVMDVTSNHTRDFELVMRMGDALSSVTDNLRGLQDSGGRKTATEVRTSGEAGASRLAAHTKLYSAQGIVDLTEQMTVNLQQNLSEEFELSILGSEANKAPVQIRPDMLVGDFQYPVNDGTLPLDRVALLDVWKEVFIAITSDPELRAGFNVPEVFSYIAELGGAKNLDQFKVQVTPMAPGAIAGAAGAGNVVQLPQAGNPIRGGNGPTPAPGVQPNPGERLIGGV